MPAPAPAHVPVPYNPAVHRLGLVPRVPDKPRLHLADFIDRHAFLRAAPPARMWIEFPAQIGGAMGNNDVGDCTAAKFGHAVAVWTADASAGKRPVILPDGAILAAYSAYSGYQAGNPATDQGATLEQANAYFKAHGVLGHKLLAYPFFAAQDHKLFAQVVNTFGCADVALMLPETAQQQIGGVWDMVGDVNTPGSQPGSWGGHDVIVCGYDPIYLYCITWGAIQPMTYRFLDAYCPDSLALLSQDWLAKGGKSPGGLNLQQLLAAARQMQAG